MFDIILQKRSEICFRIINSFWTVFFVCFQKPGLGHNMLDSSAPLKRGKERENPKPKKPSSLKKVRPHSPFIECYVIETKKSQNLLKKVMSPSWTNIKKAQTQNIQWKKIWDSLISGQLYYKMQNSVLPESKVPLIERDI